MTIRNKTADRQRVIDLDGPAGNAFALMGVAQSTARQLNWSKEQISSMLEEMKSGDYENLIEVFDRNFGDIYILERNSDESFEFEEEEW